MLSNCGAREKTLESPLTARRSNQSIPKEINSEYSLEGLILKLKLQYFGRLFFGKDPDAGKDQEKRATEDEMAGWHHQLNGHEPEQTLRDSASGARNPPCLLIMPGLLRSDRGGLSVSSPSGERKDAWAYVSGANFLS